METITIKLETMEAQVLFTELHSLIQQKERKITDALNIVIDSEANEDERDIAKECVDLYGFQCRTYWNLCNQIKDALTRN